MPADHLIRITVDGTEHELVVEPRRTLADVLRDDLHCHATNVSCEQGICGVCTVLLDGEPVRSCLVPAVAADDQCVQTVRSLAPAGALSDLQQAFTDHRALQCGFCTPGFLMMGSWLLGEKPDASDDDIREAVASNLCRCTGYSGILEAIADCRDARMRARQEASG
jgi:carbon-monoxide dehydrogenase small subunit